jgi:DNA-binding transcriptional regulator YbjK
MTKYGSESEDMENEGLDEEYDEMELLERLETLREEMEDLGVSTLSEVIERIKALHEKLDELA